MQQVHPAFKPALAAMCPPVPVAPMKRFEVCVCTSTLDVVHTYEAYHASSFEAAQAAIERHGQHIRVKVRPLP